MPITTKVVWGSSRSWSYGSWIYHSLYNQCISPLKLWSRILEDCTWYNFMWFATGRWFSRGTPVSSINKTNCHNITEIILKVALSTINQAKLVSWYFDFYILLENISCNFHRGRRGIDLCPFLLPIQLMKYCWKWQ